MKKYFYERPTFISLFAGCGGSAQGYKDAGYQPLLEIDFDKHAVQTLKNNFCGSLILEPYMANITELSSDFILDFCSLEPGELDVLDASPPCQGFSMAGKRNISDDRNQLFKDYTRILDGLKPKITIMENVEGMARGKMSIFVEEITEAIKACGYKVKCRLMNAANHGVPQNRKRLIWIGTREDLDVEISFPDPNADFVSVRKVLPHIKAFSAVQFDSKPVSSVNPCCTITKGPSLRVFEDEKGRPPTIEELKKLSSFPDDFHFTVSKTHAWNQMGNCVPPKLIQAIAVHLWDKYFKEINRFPMSPIAEIYYKDATYVVTKSPYDFEKLACEDIPVSG